MGAVHRSEIFPFMSVEGSLAAALIINRQRQLYRRKRTLEPSRGAAAKGHERPPAVQSFRVALMSAACAGRAELPIIATDDAAAVGRRFHFLRSHIKRSRATTLEKFY